MPRFETPSLKPVTPEAPQEKPRRMLEKERGVLQKIANGPAAKWFAAAALFLSAQGCGAAFREYRRDVRTDIGVDPTGGMLTVRFSERTPADRVRVAEQEGDPSFTRPGDRLVERWTEQEDHPLVSLVLDPERDLEQRTRTTPIEHERQELVTASLPTRWQQEMVPGRVYEGDDGFRYAVFMFGVTPLDPAPPYPGDFSLRVQARALFGEAATILQHEEIEPPTYRGGAPFRFVKYLVRTREPSQSPPASE